jgi:glycosyltransferase involved in cell wall biosynthesis
MTTVVADATARSDEAPEALPRVSCIMPTRDRRPFVAQALRYFLRQDYPDTELIVVDDGDDAVADLMVDDERVKYIRLRAVHSIGAKRNIACEAATGEIVAHWDDDDWSSPHRLRRQVECMLDAGADACGIREMLHYRPLRGDCWLYRGRTDARAEVAGCSIVYRRTTWRDNPFPEVNLGEDSAFVGCIPADRVLALSDRSLMIAIVHARNVSTLPLGSAQWESTPLDEIGELLAEDRPFYTLMRGGTRAPAPARSRCGISVTVAAAFDVHSGYGVTGEYLALSLARAGASVTAVALGLSAPGLSEELIAMTRPPQDQSGEGPTIYHSWLRPDIQPFCDGRELFISTMWEASRFPPAWIPLLQKARAVIVPSRFVGESCRASGVTRPIVVVPLGIDPDVYHEQPREEREGLHSLIVAPVDDRKHTHLAIEAWKTAFARDADARLVIKTTYGYHNYVPDDPRVTYVDRVEASRGIAAWYRQADILLALGSEGFGMPLVEGMATGLPVIALDAEGQADVCRDAPELVLAVPSAGQERHGHHSIGSAGYRSVPDLDAVVHHLRWVAEHRDEARDMGRAASAWAIENRNIWSVGPEVLDVVQRLSRRTAGQPGSRTLWAPTAGSACGIADYTARLQRSVPAARLTVAEPTLGSTGVVHVQHEPSIIDGLKLERFTAQARARGTAVAITEHSVFDRPSPWERDARALVAATSAGAARLRARHPDLKVSHIPLGCETWTFPRKARRGRTVGFFGFPGPHKGLGRLADVLRRVPGCDLVLYANPSAGGELTAADWPAHVPVRLQPDWIPLARVAAQLAAEADVLVFHYDEVAHVSASSAAILGLSTGVPVLTSATTWFEDLGPAVHRAGTDAAGLAAGLDLLLDDDELRARTVAAAREYCVANSWSRTGARHVELWNSLENA